MVAEIYRRSMSPHELGCARRIRAERQPLPAQEIAEQIVVCCGHNRLKAHRLARGWTVENAVRSFHEMCVSHGIRARGLCARSWLEWENDHPPSPDYQDLLCRLFLTGPVQLGFAVRYGQQGPRQPDLADTVTRAATSSFEHATGAQLSEVGPLALDQLDAELRRLALAYVCEDPLPLFQRMVALRDQVFALLGLRHHPAQATTLLLRAGQLCGLLANASLDFGLQHAAIAQARAAWAYASGIDHHGLLAWIRGLQAMIAYWSGSYGVAAELVHDGHRYAPGPTARARLFSIEALVRAASADLGGTTATVRMAAEALESGGPLDDLHDEVGGEFGFSRAKQTYLAASAYAHVGEARRAVDNARQSIQLYQSGPATARAYGNEALAHADLATGYLLIGELDGAREVIAAVLALPNSRRIDCLSRRLDRMRSQLLDDQRFTGAGLARELAERLTEFHRPFPSLGA